MLYPLKVGQKLSIGLFGESGESRRAPQSPKSRIWAEVKDAEDAAWGRRPYLELLCWAKAQGISSNVKLCVKTLGLTPLSGYC